MPSARRQIMVDAPVERVWDLIGDVTRHPEWWPRVEDVQCDLLEEGCTYRQVTKHAVKSLQTTISVEMLQDCHQLRVRCLDTGMYARFLLTPAQDGTFVDGELGVENRGMMRVIGGSFVRSWIAQSLEGLRRAATSTAGVDQQPGDEGREETPA